MGEVITFQIGNRANFVGSHVWNSRREALLVDDFPEPAAFYHSGGTKTYPRCIMIDAADNVGKLDTVLEDTRRNVSSVWGGAIQTAVHATLPEEKEVDSKCFSSQGARFWTDFMQSQMHPKSLCEFPKWTKGEYFDSYYKGLIGSPMNDTLSAVFVDGVLDKCRYFAEACDHLSTIEIITEHVGGVAGLTTSMLQALREEFGSSVCIPLWSLSDRQNDLTVLSYDGATLLDTIGNMKDQVSVLDSALFFHNSMEYCNIVVPISLHEILNSIYKGEIPSTAADRQYNKYLSTAVAAAAISTASSYRERPTQPMPHSNADEGYTHRESQDDARVRKHGGFSAASNEPALVNSFQWTAVATHRGRLPMAFLEAGFPGILNSQERKPSSAPYTCLEQYLVDSFDLKKSAVRDTVKGDLRSANPFCVPLSPVPYAFRNVDTSEDNRNTASKRSFPFQKAFTNLISVRGASGDGLRESLYSQCSEVPYRISSCQLYDAPLYVGVSSPFCNSTEDETAEGKGPANGATTAEGQPEHEFGGCAELTTALYTSPLVGQYLSQQAALWQAAASIPAVAVQLNKAGLDKTESAEVCEQLRELAQRYLSKE